MPKLANRLYNEFMGIMNPNKNKSVYSGDFNIAFGLPDPTYITFFMKFNTMGNTAGFEFGSNSCLLLPSDDINSAINYLKRINRPEESNMLKRFREQLINISENKSWIFQNIKGLESVIPNAKDLAWKLKDAKISVECLESIDNQTEHWINLYQNASFDQQFRRWLLPGNMQLFDVTVTVCEIRQIYEVFEKSARQITETSSVSNVQQKNQILTSKGEDLSYLANIIKTAQPPKDKPGNSPTDPTDIVLKNIADKLTYKIFQLERCKFDFDEAYGDSWNELHADILHSDAEPVKYKFDIIPGTVNIRTEYGFYNYVIDGFIEDSQVKTTDNYIGTSYMSKLPDSSIEAEVMNPNYGRLKPPKDSSWKGQK